MSEKHTPGPWKLAEAVKGRYTKTNLRRIRSEREGTEHGAVCEVYGIKDGTEANANARLIAAAPEMLEALRVAEESVGDLKALEIVRAAIAKATGEQK